MVVILCKIGCGTRRGEVSRHSTFGTRGSCSGWTSQNWITCWVRREEMLISGRSLERKHFVLHAGNSMKSEIHINNLQKCTFYLTGNALRLLYKDQIVNVVEGNNHCLLGEPCETHK
jgi:hypothetical protein